MLYRIFKWLFQLTVRGYFRSIYIKGLDQIPEKGPVLFVSNHNSAFMDPILLAVKIKRPLFFLARGDVFRKKFVASILNKLNMIPVFKPDITPDEMHKNQEVFQKCYEHFENGKTIVIFPEGVSKTERRLRPIKTGTARIAIGAELKNDFDLNLKIVPIGINYSNPHHFRSDVFVNIGQPFSIAIYKEDYLKNDKETVVELTERVKKEMENLVVIIEDERLDRVVKQIEILYRSKLREESSAEDKAPQDFYLSKDIVRAVEYFAQHSTEEFRKFEIKLDHYLNGLKRLKIRDTQVRSSRVSVDLIGDALYFVLGFPLFLYGTITNYVPFKIADVISQKESIRADFVGSIKMAAGMFIFLLAHIAEACLIGSFTHWWIGLIAILTFYPAGLFTIHYIKKYYQVRGAFKYVRLFVRKSDLIAGLKVTRKELVDQLEKGKEEFIAMQTNEN